MSNSIERNIYVDNVFNAADTEEQLIKFYEQSMQIMKAGGFLLRGWKSNSSKLNAHVASAGAAATKRQSVAAGPHAAAADLDAMVTDNSVDYTKNITKILGLTLNMYSDELLVCIPSMDNSVTITNRFVVSTIAKKFDPLGLLLPVTVTGKLFLQSLWKHKLAWEEPLNEELCTKWNAFVNDIVSLNPLMPELLSKVKKIIFLLFFVNIFF